MYSAVTSALSPATAAATEPQTFVDATTVGGPSVPPESLEQADNTRAAADSTPAVASRDFFIDNLHANDNRYRKQSR